MNKQSELSATTLLVKLYVIHRDHGGCPSLITLSRQLGEGASLMLPVLRQLRRAGLVQPTSLGLTFPGILLAAKHAGQRASEEVSGARAA